MILHIDNLLVMKRTVPFTLEDVYICFDWLLIFKIHD